jgi:MinD-like ATPase involved in chromosome partitioning or flagellar assembly
LAGGLPGAAPAETRVANIISVHSFRGGTGKSNTTANLAALLAAQGRRVGVVDTDIQSPGIHVLFGLRGDAIGPALNDYLWGKAAIADTARPVLEGRVPGQVFLIPSSIRTNEIVRVLREGYDVRLLTTAFRELSDVLALDTLLIDTHPGLNEETLFSLAISNILIIVMRPDQQDYEGTGVTVEVARSLDVPRLLMLVNKAPPDYDPEAVRARVEAAFRCPVAAVLPHSDDLMRLASEDIFVLRYPDHPLSAALRAVAAQAQD